MQNKKKVESKNSEKPTKQFAINVESMINGKKEMFTFSGPETASLGLDYDASYRILTEIGKIIDKRIESLKKNPTNDDKTDKHIESDSSSL